MKRGEARLLHPILAAVLIGGGLSGYSGGPPVRRTGGPGDVTCLDAGCHAGARIPDSRAIRLETPGWLRYIPGGPRERWLLKIEDSEARAYGFQLSARLASDPSRIPGGRFHEGGANIQVICQNDRPATASGCEPASLLQFVQHNAPSGTGEFEFEWTPPAENKGDILVFLAANASLAGQRASRIHLRTFRLRPTVRQGVVDAASLRSTISPGSWATMFAATRSEVSRAWRSSDFRDGNLPLSLENLSVQVNGRPAALSFVSPAQVNFLVPPGISPGSATVELFREGARLARFEVINAPIQPALFAYHAGGSYFAAAVDSRGGFITPSNPARPGAMISLYTSGLGSTLPPPPAGVAFTGAFPVQTGVLLLIGGLEVPVQFAGLVAPGLYQIHAAAPHLGPSWHGLSLEAAGKLSQEEVLLPVGLENLGPQPDSP